MCHVRFVLYLFFVILRSVELVSMEHMPAL